MGKYNINIKGGFYLYLSQVCPYFNQNPLGLGGGMPDYYQERNWTVDTSPQNLCTKSKSWDVDYMLCEKNILPAAATVTYTIQSNRLPKTLDWYLRTRLTEPDWNNPRFEYEEAPSEIASYMNPCQGDSGSGNFFANGENEDPENVRTFKFILGSITSTIIPDQINVKGVKKWLPCGSHIIDENDGDTLSIRSSSSCITWPKIFHWIKERAQLN